MNPTLNLTDEFFDFVEAQTPGSLVLAADQAPGHVVSWGVGSGEHQGSAKFLGVHPAQLADGAQYLVVNVGQWLELDEHTDPPTFHIHAPEVW
jgi:hypothetical protein